MPFRQYLKYFGVSTGTSMLAMDVLAEGTTSVTNAVTTLTPDSDTKKLLISAVTSIISTLLLKIYEDLKKRRRTKRIIQSENEKVITESKESAVGY